MPTARSWPEPSLGPRTDATGPAGLAGLAELPRAVGDVRALLAFRSSQLAARGRRRLRLAGLGALLVTLLVAVVPSQVDVARDEAGNTLALLPASTLAFLVLACVTAVTAAGGRELVPRDEAVALPVSTAADHLGALLLAPLTIAWLLQAWVLLGSTSLALGGAFTTGTRPLPLAAALLPVALWLLLATAAAQVVGWLVECVRRGPHGRAWSLAGLVVLLVVGAAAVLTGGVTALLDRSPTVAVLDAVLAGARGDWWAWAAYVGGGLALTAALVVVGALPARWALRRPMRAGQEAEAGRRAPRRTPRSDLGAVVRLDRASVWRSVPLRRGMAVLAVLPGLVAVAGAVPWSLATVLPSLVAAGGALLYGANAWCLDARGALWRESLPVPPRTVFVARGLVLLELLLVSAAATVALVAVRAGVPRPAELAAVLCSTLVVVVQVVGASMRWSLQRPFAVDLRSARATPAPPVLMVGYSARLALVTTSTAMLFAALGQLGDVGGLLGVTVVMLLWSMWRLVRTGRRWEHPVDRGRVLAAVAG